MEVDIMAVVPAYGRDYKTAKEAKEAFLSGKDFILKDITSRWDGKPCSCRDFRGEIVEVRYNKRQRLTMVPVPN
jgi:hypothetical protein